MLFLAELPWCLIFMQKSDFLGKSWKIPQSSYFTRRHTEPEYETERGHKGLTPPGGTGQARPRHGVVWPPQPSPRPLLPPTYTLWPENIGGLAFFSDRVPLRRHHQKLTELEIPFWHPIGTGIWRRSSPSSSPTSLHQPSMIPTSMCE
jgi:hypothetical protein